MRSENDADDTESSTIYGWGAGRRKILAAIEEADDLSPIDEFQTLEDVTDAVRELSLETDSFTVRSEPADLIETIESVHQGLPEEAKPHYVGDDVLRQRINRARRQFDEYLSKTKRSKEMPSPVEAGRADYPAEKARERSERSRESSEELNERIEDIESAARGARQRALVAIGSSVAEQNEQERKSQREQMREQLEPSDIIRFRNPRWTVGEVVRVNKKTVTARYPNPRAGGTKPMSDEPEPDYLETRVELDSDYLVILTDERLQDIEDVEYDSVAELRTGEFDDA